MLDPQQIAEAAEQLFFADKNRQQINLLSQQYPDITMDDAYAIQDALVQKKLADGRKQIGWKIGLTSKAMQNALNIDTPDSGILLDDMLFENGATIPANRFIQPRIEAEIAFVMKDDVDKLTVEAILNATDYVTPVIEILDTRIVRQDKDTGQIRKIFDTIADNAANAGLVLGDVKYPPQQIDLRWVGAIVKRDNIVEETGLGAAVLDHPIISMLWLVERLQKYGQKIRAGDIVLSGSFIKALEAPSGSNFQADFGIFGLVKLKFA